MKKAWTGERLETHIEGSIAIEHLHRYALVNNWTRGKKVLDMACGEGYGSNLISKSAYSVIGMDIDHAVIQNATAKYRQRNLRYIQGEATKIPFENNSFDVVVCFETIEHLSEHNAMLSEIKRVLTADGILVISSPDKKFYSEERDYNNSFHVKELYSDEFRAVVASYFSKSYFLKQNFFFSSVVHSESGNNEVRFYSGNYDSITELETMPHLFLICVASDKEIEPPGNSLFIGKENFETALESKFNALKYTWTYKVGHFVLWPLKKVYNFLK